MGRGSGYAGSAGLLDSAPFLRRDPAYELELTLREVREVIDALDPGPGESSSAQARLVCEILRRLEREADLLEGRFVEADGTTQPRLFVRCQEHYLDSSAGEGPVLELVRESVRYLPQQTLYTSPQLLEEALRRTFSPKDFTMLVDRFNLSLS